MTESVHRRIAAALAVGLVLALASCSAPEPAPTAPADQTLTADQQWGANTADCVREEGWEVDVFPDGSISPADSVPSSQMGQYDTAVAACRSQFDVPSVPLDQLNAEQWADLYQQEVATAECLRAEGVEVPRIPSTATFEDRYKSSDPWTSYSFVGAVNEQAWLELSAKCPQPTI